VDVLLTALLLLQERTPEQLVESLRSERIEEREKAAAALLARGVGAVAALEALRKDPDPELSMRVQSLIDSIGLAALKKLEDTLDAAKSIRVKVRGEGAICREGTLEKLSISTEILIGESDRAKISSAMVRNGAAETFDMLSDGFEMQGRVYPDEVTKLWITPTNYKPGLVSFLVRLGEDGVREGVRKWYTVKTREAQPKPRKTCRMGGFVVAVAGKQVSLSFTIEGPDVSVRRAGVRIVYDSATGALLRRSLTTVDDDDRSHEYTETYTEFTLNADIPRETFALPEEKK
jgi:hypothetical protein